MEKEMRGLVERIREGDCVLVLGPRIAVRPNDPERRPLDELLAEKILAEVPAQGPAVLRSAAELLWHATKDEYLLSGLARDFYEEYASSTTDFHRDLAELPFRLCINASPDDLMFNAFAQAKKTPQRGHYSFREATQRPAIPTADRPLVYHLFGHHSDPKSLVLTEGHLIEFLVNVSKGTPSLPDQVRHLVGDRASFLFLGFGFHHWYLRVLLQVMNAYGRRSKAFEDQQFFDHPEHDQTARFFTDRLIEFRPLQWDEFAKQLRATYETTKKPSATAPRVETSPAAAPSSRKPKAFLSYASQDRAAVEELAERLEMQGIDVWQDKQDLRAGDNWEITLQHVIRNLVDYVIVVQTPAMFGRVEGVFVHEVDAALHRQKGMTFAEDGQQFRFLIPVTIGDSPLLPPLRHLHAIDASVEERVAELARSILEDWDRRIAHQKAVA